MFAGAEFRVRFVLEGFRLENVPERINPIGDQTFEIELGENLTVRQIGDFGHTVAGPETDSGHAGWQPLLEVALLLRKQRDHNGLAYGRLGRGRWCRRGHGDECELPVLLGFVWEKTPR